MSKMWWILEAIEESRFPYRLSIQKGDHTLLCLKAQDRWPRGRGNIFCLRHEEAVDPPLREEIERVPVVSLRRYGKKLSVVLDRAKHKRCDFLFLTKKYKSREGEYEQIF